MWIRNKKKRKKKKKKKRVLSGRYIVSWVCCVTASATLSLMLYVFRDRRIFRAYIIQLFRPLPMPFTFLSLSLSLFLHSLIIPIFIILEHYILSLSFFLPFIEQSRENDNIFGIVNAFIGSVVWSRVRFTNRKCFCDNIGQFLTWQQFLLNI